MWKTTLLAAALVTLGVLPAGAQSPRFRDFPAQPFSGPAAPLVLGPADVNFRARLREAARQKPNFAGDYSLATWGCGAGCVMGAAVNLRTGRVAWLPSTICCWPADVDDNFQPVRARLDSTLLVLTGLRDEKEGDQGAHFYRIESGHFVHLRDLPPR